MELQPKDKEDDFFFQVFLCLPRKQQKITSSKKKRSLITKNKMKSNKSSERVNLKMVLEYSQKEIYLSCQKISLSKKAASSTFASIMKKKSSPPKRKKTDQYFPQTLSMMGQEIVKNLNDSNRVK